MVLKLQIDMNTMKEAIDGLKSIVTESRLKFTQEGLTVTSIDPANAAMVQLELNKGAFTELKSTDMEIGIDITKFSSVLEMGQKGDSLFIEHDEKTHKLDIKMGVLKYTMSLLDPSCIRKDPKVPNLDMPATITMRGTDMGRGIKASSKISDYIKFVVSRDSFKMAADGDTDTVAFSAWADGSVPAGETDAAKLIGMNFTGSTIIESLYSTSYLEDIQKVIKDKEVTIKMGKDYPAIISCPLINNNGSISYTIAPRVESE